jgi:hypothetical protein
MSMDAMAGAAPELVKLSPQTGKNMSTVADAVSDISWFSWWHGASLARLTDFVEALGGAMGDLQNPSTAGTTAAGGGGTEIILKLNERELGRTVKAALSKGQAPLKVDN